MALSENRLTQKPSGLFSLSTLNNHQIGPIFKTHLSFPAVAFLREVISILPSRAEWTAGSQNLRDAEKPSG